MYSYRIWQPDDLPWLFHAAAAGAWESASDEERAAAAPQLIASGAQQLLQSVLSAGTGTAIIATAQGGPVGFVLFAVGPDSTTDEPNGYLMSGWVDPQHRRRGIFRQLHALAERILAQIGIRKAKICTGLHNQAVVNLARQAGYAPEGLIGIKEL
ncbi:MAG: putative acetyltransferase [Firmicutes bacterium]|nr:putative acetyltransferase [Bacillota bacterium]